MNFDRFRSGALRAIRGVVRQIQDLVAVDPFALTPAYVRGEKRALTIDLTAEMLFRIAFRRYDGGRFSGVTILGEESLSDPALDLSEHSGIYCLLDAVDGTDLLERRLSNWCSAAVFFEPTAPSGRRILGAFVCLPNQHAYYATTDREGAFVQATDNGESRLVAGPSNVRSVENASICFYGQKVDNLLSLYENGFLVHLRDRLNTAIERGHEVTTRLYNLGGIPMMMKMVDKLIVEAHGIDAVVELRGQRAHDVVPGAFIAAHAGAALCRLDGADCTLTMLEELLLRPAAVETRLSYVIAGTQTLATELCRLVTGTEA